MGDVEKEIIRRLQLRTAAGNANELNSMRPLGEDEALSRALHGRQAELFHCAQARQAVCFSVCE